MTKNGMIQVSIYRKYTSASTELTQSNQDNISTCTAKWKGCFNLGRIISVAASPPNNVNTSRLITLLVHYRSPLQFQTCRRVNNKAKSRSHN